MLPQRKSYCNVAQHHGIAKPPGWCWGASFRGWKAEEGILSHSPSAFLTFIWPLWEQFLSLENFSLSLEVESAMAGFRATSSCFWEENPPVASPVLPPGHTQTHTCCTQGTLLCPRVFWGVQSTFSVGRKEGTQPSSSFAWARSSERSACGRTGPIGISMTAGTLNTC